MSPPRRPPGDTETPMVDLWFLTGVVLAAVTLLCLGMDLQRIPLAVLMLSGPWICIVAGFALGKGSTPTK